jgi:hypothetical protein
MSQQAASTIDAIESTKEQVIISEERDNTKPESFEVSDVITDIITKLEAEVKRSFSLGRTSRLAAWRSLKKIYDDREVLLKDKPKYLDSFPQYIFDTFEVSTSAAYSDHKVVSMLSSEGDKVLDSEHNDLIYMVRTIANAPEKMWKPLLKDILKYDRDSLSEAIAKLRKGKTKKKKSVIVEQDAKWDDVSTFFNPKTASLRIEYTGESKDTAKEYLEAVQKLLVSMDQEEVINLANSQPEEDSAPSPIDAPGPAPSSSVTAKTVPTPDVTPELAPSPSVPLGPAPVLTHDEAFPNQNPFQ